MRIYNQVFILKHSQSFVHAMIDQYSKHECGDILACPFIALTYSARDPAMDIHTRDMWHPVNITNAIFAMYRVTKPTNSHMGRDSASPLGPNAMERLTVACVLKHSDYSPK